MKATLLLHIVIGVLFILPLLLFNIRRIFVRKPPEPMRFNWLRCIVILAIAGFIAFFLVCSYQTTMHNRYDIAIERIAEKHAEYLVGLCAKEEFYAFVEENGTDAVGDSLESADLSGLKEGEEEARFQISDWLIPRYWEENEDFPQTEVLGDENPVYLLYRMETGGEQELYLVRMVMTEEGWKYDYFSLATEEQISAMNRHLPSERNGKWYVVKG